MDQYWHSAYERARDAIRGVLAIRERAALGYVLGVVSATYAELAGLRADVAAMRATLAGDPRIVRKTLYELRAGPGRPAPSTVPLYPTEGQAPGVGSERRPW